jgi:DNA-binding SARP family transcriptional activator
LRLITAATPSGGSAGSPDHAEVPAVHLRLVGTFQLMISDKPVTLSIGAQRLLALLALRDGGMTRSRAAQTLWPDMPESRAYANLRTALHRLARQACAAADSQAGLLRLAPTVSVDVRQVNTAAARLLDLERKLDPAYLSSSLGCSLYDDLLPEWSDEWLAADQIRFRQLRLHCLEVLAGRLATIGRYGAAMDAALAALHADTLRESAHEQLIRVCLAEGNRNEAIRHFTTYCRVMREELGLDPAARLSNLVWPQEADRDDLVFAGTRAD